MKNSILVFTILILLGCSKDDTMTILDGEWNLINISGGFAGVNDTIDMGAILWTFDEENLSLTIDNTNLDTVIYDGGESGVYPFTVTSSSEDSTLQVMGSERRLSITLNNLVIDDSPFITDGFRLEFTR